MLPTSSTYDLTKAIIIIHEDYRVYPSSLTSQLKDANGCIWAQEISQNQVSEEEYIKITHDFPLAAAKSFATLSTTHFNFIYVSDEGADSFEKTFMLFGKIKGRTEKELLALSDSDSLFSTLRVYNVRPGYVDPSIHSRSIVTSIMDKAVAPMLRWLTPSMVSPVAILSKPLVDLAIGDGKPLNGPGIEAEGRTLRNTAIRRLGDLT